MRVDPLELHDLALQTDRSVRIELGAKRVVTGHGVVAHSSPQLAISIQSVRCMGSLLLLFLHLFAPWRVLH